MKKAANSWEAVSLLRTSSIRFEKLGAPIINKLGVRAIIGKRTMGAKTIESTWVLEVENFGPFVVDIDTKGNNLFNNVTAEADKRFEAAYERYGIKGYAYTGTDIDSNLKAC